MLGWIVAEALGQPVQGRVDLHARLASHVPVHAYRPGPDGCFARDADVSGYERVGLAHVGYVDHLF